MKVIVELSRGKYHGRRYNRIENRPDLNKGVSIELHIPEPLLENTEAMSRAFEGAHQVLLDHYQGGVLKGNPVHLVIEVDSS